MYVPIIADINAKIVFPIRLDFGNTKIAISIPNCADDIVAPVDGETNLFMQSCCIIRPATLIPTPVHRIARSRGNLEIIRISSCSKLPAKSSDGVIVITPRNKDTADKIINMTNKNNVSRFSLLIRPPINTIIFFSYFMIYECQDEL